MIKFKHILISGVDNKMIIIIATTALAGFVVLIPGIDWQAIARYVFFCVIASVVIRPIGLTIGGGIRRSLSTKKGPDNSQDLP